MQNKCIGECIEPGEKTLHPISLEIISNTHNNNVCPAEPYLIYNKKEESIECNSENIIIFDQIEDMILAPKIKFNIKSFLDLYNITSFNTGLLWLKININKKPFFNINRIINSLWITYNYQVKKISTELINIYISILENILDNKTKNKILKSKMKNKIIKKSLKKFIKANNNWDEYNFNPNEKITLLLIKYFKKYN